MIVVFSVIGWALTKDQTKRRKRIIWGIMVMIGLNPFVSWLIGICYAIFGGGGFEGMGIMILFVAYFIIGAFILISGLFTKIGIEQVAPK